MALFDTGTGFFMQGVVDQSNRNRQLSVQESLADLEKTKLGIELSRSQQKQASEFIEELVTIASEIKQNYPGTSEEFRNSKAARSVDALLAEAEQRAGSVGLPPVDYRTKIENTPTQIDAASTEGSVEAVKTLATRSGLRSGGLGERQLDAATGTEPRTVQTQNFINADTGERTFVDMTAPNAPEEVAALKSRGFTEFGQAVQASDLGGLTTKEKSDFGAAEFAAANVISQAEALKEQLGDDPLTSMVGGVVRGLSSLAGNVRQLAQLSGGTATVAGEEATESQLLNAANYTFESFGEEAAKSQAFKSNMLALAYSLARAAEPGGRLSDRDVQVQLDGLAAGSGDRGQIEAAIDEAVRRTRSAYSIRREQATLRGEALPPPPTVLRQEESQPEVSPNVQAVIDKGENATAEDISKLTDEELKELERLLGAR